MLVYLSVCRESALKVLFRLPIYMIEAGDRAGRWPLANRWHGRFHIVRASITEDGNEVV